MIIALKFKGELNDLIDDDQEEEPAHLTPEPLKAPSPQPTSFNSLQLLKDRKQMYETAATNAQATGQSSKVCFTNVLVFKVNANALLGYRNCNSGSF